MVKKKKDQAKKEKKQYDIKLKIPGKTIKEHFWSRWFSGVVYRINFYKPNGTKDEYFSRALDHDRFIINNQTYIILMEAAIWNNNIKTYEIDYFEGIALPVIKNFSPKRILDVKNEKYKIIDNAGKEKYVTAHEYLELNNVRLSLDARALTDILKGDYIKNTMKGSEMMETFNKILRFSFLNLVGVIGIALLFMWKAGMI